MTITDNKTTLTPLQIAEAAGAEPFEDGEQRAMLRPHLETGTPDTRPSTNDAQSVICNKCAVDEASIDDYKARHLCDRDTAVALLTQEHQLRHSGIDTAGLSPVHLGALLSVDDPVIKRRLAKETIEKHLSGSRLSQRVIDRLTQAEAKTKMEVQEAQPETRPVPSPTATALPTKVKASRTPKLVAPLFKYHYTVAELALLISKDGFIKTTDRNIDPGETPAAWFSTSTDWDESANKGVTTQYGQLGLTRRGTELVGRGLVRFVVERETAPISWSEFKRTSGISKRSARHAARTGNPHCWFASYEPVPQSKWLRVEVWNGETWTTVSDIMEYLTEAMKTLMTSPEEIVTHIARSEENVLTIAAASESMTSLPRVTFEAVSTVQLVTAEKARRHREFP